MFPLRNALRNTGTAGASSSRAAFQAAATRVPESTDLEKEQWVAAEVEDSGSPRFTEPLTIDELEGAREDLEKAFHSESQEGAPAFLSAEEDVDTPANAGYDDADMQMAAIQQTAMQSRTAATEYLDAALLVAADTGVQRALLNALLNNPDAQAALQRGFASQGLSVDMQRLQGKLSLLPPAAAVAAHGIEVTEVTDEPEAVQEEGPSLKEALDKITAEVLQKLSTFGDRVQSVLHSVLRRWRRRLQILLNPGSVLSQGRARGAGCRDADEGAAVSIVDGILSAAALIVTIALFKRVPLLRR